MNVRPYAPGDEPGVLRVWNEGLHADPIAVGVWREKVLLDPNFASEGCLVAESGGNVRGFILCLVRRVPFFNDGSHPDLGWITAFAVEPGWQGFGIGAQLLDRGLAWFHAQGRRSVRVANYVPNYFLPGVDVKAYAGGLDFLLRRGFAVIQRPLSMQAMLPQDPLAVQADQHLIRVKGTGIEVRRVSPPDITPLLDFVRQHFSWSWYLMATEVLHGCFVGDPRNVGMWLAVRDGEVLGYAQYRAERFGTFGVRSDLRGQGIGAALLAATINDMCAKGFHTAWFLWTSDNAARLYARCGFREVRRFAVLEKTLEEGR